METPLIFTKREDVPTGIPVIEAFERSLGELFFVRNPKLRKGPDTMPLAQDFINQEKTRTPSTWIYYPWLKTAVHLPDQDIYFELRTARNRNIINIEEQHRFRNAFVGIAGMSVGSNIATTLTLTGGPQHMRLADFDEIEATNLNRIRAPIWSIGVNKAEFFSRLIWEVDPWAELDVWANGIAKNTLDSFMKELNVFIDEMDSIELKVRARFAAKKQRVPVLMATDNGDNVIFDVERYDTDPNTPIFNGRVEISEQEIENLKTFHDWIRIAVKIVGSEAQPLRMLESLLELGKTISGVPQLGSSASIAGAVVSYGVRRIACGDPLPSGRYEIRLDEKIIPGYSTTESIEARNKQLQDFFRQFSSK